VRYLLFIITACALVACSHKTSSPKSGYYTLLFSTPNGNIPARLNINDTSGWQIINSEEIIRLDSVVLRGDSFFIQLPLFDSSLKGTWRNDSLFGEWTDHSRSQYSIPFTGVPTAYSGYTNIGEELQYEVVFSPSDTAESSKGIAVLQKRGNLVTGTILTETGDYRYLQGEVENNTLWLSAFDGTHLFYLEGTLKGDSITNGLFLSGKHWKENWIAEKSITNTLRNPHHITTLQVNINPQFDVLSSSGDTIHFDSTTWKNHVTIIQIMGSWCPNCTDESRFLKELYANHKNDGLQIIPIAFERGEDVKTACMRVQNQFKQLGVPYPFYYGGKSSKEEAQKTLSFLTEVHSFPTTIFIDKNGVVRRVYTGFSGPGTHEEYEKLTYQINDFVSSLLSN
jgi:thiol-disulfide isomerase/thioredoxin